METDTLRFADLDLPEPLARAIAELGWERLTPVQARSLPATLKGRDVAAQGRTGTGKTAAFLITVFARLLRNAPPGGRAPADVRALVIAPTRELAVQIARDAEALGRYTDFRLHLVYGGMGMERQRRGFEGGVDVLVGTPGRLLDFYRQRLYSLRRAEIVVVDEADRMFDLGFIRDLRTLLRRCPPPGRRQTLLFSATLSHRVLELAYSHTNEPVHVRGETGTVAAERVEERVYFPANPEKLPLLVALLRQEAVERGMIFTNEKRTAEQVARGLARYGFAVGLLSGDVRQKKRLRILDDFQAGRLKLLVATDVASRGLHVPGVSHVFNYDLPQNPEDYVHRIGRTARAGATGVAISFACESYALLLPEIEAYIQREIPRARLDGGMLEVGPPTHPDALPEGLSKGDRAVRRQGGGAGRGRRGRRGGGRRRGGARAAKAS